MTTLYPTSDRVLLRRLASEERTAGGLFIPEVAKEKPHRGIVVAVGPGRQLESGVFVTPEVQVGDLVIFGKYAGSDVAIDGVEHVLLRADDILAVVEGGA